MNNELNEELNYEDVMWRDVECDSTKAECVFCDRLLRKRNGKNRGTVQTVSEDKRNHIRNILHIENSDEKLHKIEDNKPINFHESCLAERNHKLFYKDRANKKTEVHASNNWDLLRLAHEKTFDGIKEFVLNNVICAKRVCALKIIYDMYKASFDEVIAEIQPKSHLDTSAYKQQHLCKKLLNTIPNLSKVVYKSRTFLHLSDLDLAELYANLTQPDDTFSQIKSVAFEIRKKVLEQDRRHLPKHNISVENFYEGECEIPVQLYTLINCLLSGPKGSKNEKKEIRVKSICNSIIFSTTNGEVKPSSCLSLGLVTKNITGSRRMVEILNRMGHCISYTCVEELETELAYGCAANTQLLPYSFTPRNPTHVAFDNFDKFVETSSGKDTLHDTVGIVYQNFLQTGEKNENVVAVPTSQRESEVGRKRRKYYSAFDSTIEPYSINSQSLPLLTKRTNKVPENLQTATNFNHLWMLHHAFDITGASRWFSWNSERAIDTNPIQKIGYLPNVNMSPTSDAVVLKTLRMALTIADECEQEYIIVTYDLAIACKAYKIQADMSPDLDRIFITLGAFHTELSYFKV